MRRTGFGEGGSVNVNVSLLSTLSILHLNFTYYVLTSTAKERQSY